jgi:hypothetical protein
MSAPGVPLKHRRIGVYFIVRMAIKSVCAPAALYAAALGSALSVGRLFLIRHIQFFNQALKHLLCWW